jgi:glycosyltransferase involved in cell wall biosynthesis
MNRLIDHYIMVCDRVGQVNHEREGIPYRMMETVYNGVDLNRFAPNGKPRALTLRRQQGIGDNDFVLGTVAIFRPEKAYHVLLKAIEEIRPSIPNLRVLLIGKGPLEKSMRERCRQMGLDENVRFLGYVEDVERCLSLMDVFCLVPNSNEGFSNAIIEAMAAGRPVIATDVGGNAEAVVHGETGLIIPPDDPGALADAIVRLYRDESARLSMGRKGRERAEKEFDVEKMIINLQEIYDRLMGYRRDVPGNGNRPASLGEGREKEDRKEPSRSV